jgi:hypothetical protein
LLKTIVDHELIGQVRLPYSAGVHIYVKSVTFSPDGQTVLSGSQDGMLRLWDVASSRLLKTLMGHSDGVMSVAFSPDGRSALSGSDDDTLKLWDVASGRLRRTFEGHQRGVESVAFSPDGRSLLSGSADDKLKLWDAASGRLLKTLTGHGDIVRSVAFSPDGRSVLSGSDDRTLKLWDVASGEVLATFPPGTGDGLKAPPDATPLSAAVGAETEYYRAFYSTTPRQRRMGAGDRALPSATCRGLGSRARRSDAERPRAAGQGVAPGRSAFCGGIGRRDAARRAGAVPHPAGDEPARRLATSSELAPVHRLPLAAWRPLVPDVVAAISRIFDFSVEIDPSHRVAYVGFLMDRGVVELHEWHSCNVASFR